VLGRPLTYYYFVNAPDTWETGVHFVYAYGNYTINSIEEEDMLLNKFLLLNGHHGKPKEYELVGKNKHYYEVNPLWTS
jgi:hypothetical protein